jgi:hypothetical protein
MTNENCLEGIRCPDCGNEDCMLIMTTVLAEVTDDGADIADCSGMHWDGASMTRCPECDKEGLLRAFRGQVGMPPDSDGMNDKRTHWAFVALMAFMAETGTDREDAVCDLVCDLMHWCDRNGMIFDAELERARWHYGAETSSAEPTL